MAAEYKFPVGENKNCGFEGYNQTVQLGSVADDLLNPTLCLVEFLEGAIFDFEICCDCYERTCCS
jgi:hypothetical protein